MQSTKYKNHHRQETYDRIEIIVPRGMKKKIKNLASDNNLSVSAYIQTLVKKDQEGIFDAMQIADKNRKYISEIKRNKNLGYDITFTDGHTITCQSKKSAREYIIKYCRKKAPSTSSGR